MDFAVLFTRKFHGVVLDSSLEQREVGKSSAQSSGYTIPKTRANLPFACIDYLSSILLRGEAMWKHTGWN
jgi:hypothetical protein